MSQYTSYQYETEPAVTPGVLASAAGVAGMLLSGAASLAVRSLKALRKQAKARIDTLEEMGKSPAMARLEALCESPLLEAAVLKELSQDSGLSGSGHGELLDRLRQSESSQLDRLIRLGNNRLLQGQARVLHHSVTDVLAELGYAIRTPRRPLRDVVIVQGFRAADNTAISVRLTPKDEKVETDLSGFNGGACTQLLGEFEEGLRRRGVILQMVQRKPHGCAGGYLTQDINHVLDGKPVKGKTNGKKSKRKMRTSTARLRVRN